MPNCSHIDSVMLWIFGSGRPSPIVPHHRGLAEFLVTVLGGRVDAVRGGFNRRCPDSRSWIRVRSSIAERTTAAANDQFAIKRLVELVLFGIRLAPWRLYGNILGSRLTVTDRSRPCSPCRWLIRRGVPAGTTARCEAASRARATGPDAKTNTMTRACLLLADIIALHREKQRPRERAQDTAPVPALTAWCMSCLRRQDDTEERALRVSGIRLLREAHMGAAVGSWSRFG
jgi:hypothetical protein